MIDVHAPEVLCHTCHLFRFTFANGDRVTNELQKAEHSSMEISMGGTYARPDGFVLPLSARLAKPWRQRIAQDLFNRAVRPYFGPYAARISMSRPCFTR